MDFSPVVNLPETTTPDNQGMTSEELQIEKRSFGEITILDCSGRIVVARETDYLFHTVTSAMEKSRSVLLNLGGITAVDSGGLGMIVLLHRYAVNSSCDLKLCNPSSRVSEVFALTDLHTVVDVHENEDAAIENFFRDVA